MKLKLGDRTFPNKPKGLKCFLGVQVLRKENFKDVMFKSILRLEINSMENGTGSDQAQLYFATQCLTSQQSSHFLNPDENPPLLNPEEGTGVRFDPVSVSYVDKLRRVRPVYSLKCLEAVCKGKNSMGNPN